jgi:general secretion pathway protein K
MKASTVLQRRLRGKSRERGVALVSVLLALVVLTVYLTEVQEQGATAFSSAISERDKLRAEYLARSAINLSRMLIAVEPTVRKVVQPIFALISPGGKAPQIPVWKFSDDALGPYNDAAGAAKFAKFAGVDPSSGVNIGLGDAGHFDITIVDEDSKVDVNVAARGDIISRTRLSQQLLGLMSAPQYAPMFEQLDADGQHSDRQAICGAMIDWADSDEEREPCDPKLAQAAPQGGAEDNYYQSIGLKYFRKNAAFDSLDELRLIRGVSDDFWATFVDPDPRKPDKRVMTVWGQGKVNVNTANAQTLLAIVCAGAPTHEVCTDPLKSASFVSSVSLVKSFTAGAPLFGSPKDFILTMQGQGMAGPFLFGPQSPLQLKPVQFKSPAEMAKIISTESKMFSIYATGVVRERPPAPKEIDPDGEEAEEEVEQDDGRGRETRVTIHAVVDFRKAMTMADVMRQMGLNPDGTTAITPPPGQPGGAPSPTQVYGIGGQSLDPAMAKIATSPAGNIVYWRVE